MRTRPSSPEGGVFDKKCLPRRGALWERFRYSMQYPIFVCLPLTVWDRFRWMSSTALPLMVVLFAECPRTVIMTALQTAAFFLFPRLRPCFVQSAGERGGGSDAVVEWRLRRVGQSGHANRSLDMHIYLSVLCAFSLQACVLFCTIDYSSTIATTGREFAGYLIIVAISIIVL